MLSTMESHESREMLRTLARAEAAPHLSYPKLPRWAPVVFGAWFAAIAAGLGHADHTGGKLGLAALLLVEALFLRWFSRAHGAMPWPGRGNPPTEIARLYDRRYEAAGAAVRARLA